MTDDEVAPEPNSPKKHTPGRGHRRTSDPAKKRRWRRRKLSGKELNAAAADEKRRKWQDLTDEQRKLLRGTEADPDR